MITCDYIPLASHYCVVNYHSITHDTYLGRVLGYVDKLKTLEFSLPAVSN